MNLIAVLQDLAARRVISCLAATSRLKSALIMAFILLTCFPYGGGLSADEGMLKSSERISADIVELIAGREIRERQSHFWMSTLGLAMETKGTPGKSPRIVYLFNYKEKQSWIISPEGKRYCEVPKRANEKKIVGGILSTHPCLGYESLKIRETEWSGLIVTVWECRKQQQVLATQFYSELYGIVVREEASDGIVRELRNFEVADKVSAMTYAEGVSGEFKPDSTYRSVTLDEFFFAKRPLEKYLE